MTDERLEKAISLRKDIKKAEEYLLYIDNLLCESDLIYCLIGKKGSNEEIRVKGKEVVKLVKRLRRNQVKLIASLKKQYEMM